MTQAPYRTDPGAWVDRQAPRGIVFRGEDHRLLIEVRRYLPPLIAAAVGAAIGVTIAERGYFHSMERRVKLADIGPPRVGRAREERGQASRWECLEIPERLDRVAGGQSVPIQILIGYNRARLEWLRDEIGRWLARDRAK